ncbi:MAG TPA: hypothetical protein P5096_02690 [Patescibacteria group bacterium]|nr:hypothetical protein [Patescibacteria group bacterium]
MTDPIKWPTGDNTNPLKEEQPKVDNINVVEKRAEKSEFIEKTIKNIEKFLEKYKNEFSDEKIGEKIDELTRMLPPIDVIIKNPTFNISPSKDIRFIKVTEFPKLREELEGKWREAKNYFVKNVEPIINDAILIIDKNRDPKNESDANFRKKIYDRIANDAKGVEDCFQFLSRPFNPEYFDDYQQKLRIKMGNAFYFLQEFLHCLNAMVDNIEKIFLDNQGDVAYGEKSFRHTTFSNIYRNFLYTDSKSDLWEGLEMAKKEKESWEIECNKLAEVGMVPQYFK